MNEPRALPKAPVYKPEGYDASRDAFKGDNQANEPRALPEAPVYKPVEYDSTRDEILEDPNKVKEPRVLPKAPMYKPEGYDASRDAPEVNEPRALYSSEASLCRPATRNTSALPCGRRSPSTLGLNSHQSLFDPTPTVNTESLPATFFSEAPRIERHRTLN